MNTRYLLFLIIISFSLFTATQIKNSSLSEGLIAYYSFEETEGDVVFDELQTHNEYRYGALQNQKGIVGNCYYYDGIDDYVTLSSIDLQTSNTWSNNVWVYYKGIVQYTNIIRMENKFINFYDHIGNNKLIFWYYDQNQKGQEIKTSVQIADVTNRWVMSTLTYDGYTLKYYIDGKLISSIDTLINHEGPIERQFISKSEPGSNQKHYTRAYVDELGFWNRALSSEEITLLYNEGKGISYDQILDIENIQNPDTNTNQNSNNILYLILAIFILSVIAIGILIVYILYKIIKYKKSLTKSANIKPKTIIYNNHERYNLHKQMFIAIKKGDISEIKKLSNYIDLNERIIVDNNIYPLCGNTTLSIACYYGQLDIVKILIKQGVNVNTLCKNDEPYNIINGRTALMIAILGENQLTKLAIVKELIKAGADIKIREVSGWDALLISVIHKKLDITKELLSNGADINQKYQTNTKKYSLLSEVIKYENENCERINFLISNGAKINYNDPNEENPLIIAILNRKNKIFNLLIDIAELDINSSTAHETFKIALYNENLEVAKKMIDLKFNINSKYKNNYALTEICKYDRFKSIEFLLENGANINIIDSEGRTPVEIAYLNRNNKIVNYLISKGAKLDKEKYKESERVPLRKINLTSFIKDPEVKKKFSEYFPLPKFDLKNEIKAPPLTQNYSLIGTSFDYLLRFYIQKYNQNCITKQWIAEKALEILESISLEDKLIGEVKENVREARENYNKFLEDGIISENLLKSCILLGRIDPIFRARYIDPNINVVNKEDIQDMKNLIELVNKKDFISNNKSILNPTFGKASKLIGGADADMIIDNNLIDIKTTKELKFTKDHYYQLIGYYLLSIYGGIDNYDIPIKNISIYYSRYGILYTIPAPTRNEKFEEFYKWFKETIEQ
jgi:ankyrin repeat protein